MKIITVTTNNPTFVELQYKSIKKYVANNDKIEFIVFNDAKAWPDITNFRNSSVKQKIRDMCNKLNIQCIDIPNKHHRRKRIASDRHADSVNFITKYI